MSQNSLTLPTSGTLSGLQAVIDINAALDTLNTKWSGGSAPATPEFGQSWLDTSTTPNTLRIYDGAQWVAVGTLDATNHLWVPATGPGVTGAHSGLTLSATGTSASVSVNANQVVVSAAAGLVLKTLTGVALTINTAAAGANGLDTGTLAASTWYAVHVIYNPTTGATAGLISLSATAPTLPSGYTYSGRVGWIRTDGTANKYPLSFSQAGRRAHYVLGGNVATLPVLVQGVAGTYNINTPAWAPVAVSSAVPPTATEIELIGAAQYNTGTGPGAVLVAPNGNYGGSASTKVPPLSTDVFVSGGATKYVIRGRLTLESTNIYVATQTAATAVLAAGWTDNF